MGRTPSSLLSSPRRPPVARPRWAAARRDRDADPSDRKSAGVGRARRTCWRASKSSTHAYLSSRPSWPGNDQHRPWAPRPNWSARPWRKGRPRWRFISADRPRPRRAGGSREGILQRILRRCQNDYGRDAKSLDWAQPSPRECRSVLWPARGWSGRF